MRRLACYRALLALGSLPALAWGKTEVYFEDHTQNAQFRDWQVPIAKEEKLGFWRVIDGEDGGARTTSDQHRHVFLKHLWQTFSTENRTFVLQLSVRFPPGVECAGGYINLYDKNASMVFLDQMGVPLLSFGPNICGRDQQVLVSWRYRGKQHAIRKDIPTPYDTVSHLYTLHVQPDQTYEVFVDWERVASGSLTRDWRMLPPRYIQDVNAPRPADWQTAAEIDDPADVRPADWDESKRGPWQPRRIPNPKYEGPWVPPVIENPEYYRDDRLYVLEDVMAMGFDVWQSQSGTTFGHILITDSLEYARNESMRTWRPLYERQKAEYDEEMRKTRERYEEIGRRAHAESYAQHLQDLAAAKAKEAGKQQRAHAADRAKLASDSSDADNEGEVSSRSKERQEEL